MMTNTNYQVIATGLEHTEGTVVHTAATHAAAKSWAEQECMDNEGWDGEIMLDIVEADEPTKLSNPSDFIFAGNATFTIVSAKSGSRFTYRIRRAKGDDAGRPWFVSVLTGSDNEDSYTYAGCVFPGSKFIPGKKSNHVSPTAPSSRGIAWLVGQLRGDCAKLDQVEIFHAGRCGRCGRQLTVPESIETGFGPECIKHI